MSKQPSHMTILRKIFKAIDIDTVLEFGTGLISTPFFIDRCKSVVSVEQQDRRFHQMAQVLHEEYQHLLPLLLLGPGRGSEWLASADDVYDLVLVDGHSQARYRDVNEAFSHTEIIVAHDTEDKRYSWEKIVVPEGWQIVECTAAPIHTTVWTKRAEVVDALTAKKKENE